MEYKRVQRTETVYRFFDVKCENCGSNVIPEYDSFVDKEDGSWSTLQLFPGQLKITVDHNKYDVYRDPILLCEICTNSLISDWPIFEGVDHSW